MTASGWRPTAPMTTQPRCACSAIRPALARFLRNRATPHTARTPRAAPVQDMAEAARQAALELQRDVAAAAVAAAREQQAAASTAEVQVAAPAPARQQQHQRSQQASTSSRTSSSPGHAATASSSSTLGVYLAAAALAGGMLFFAFRQTITAGAKTAVLAGSGAIGSALQQKKLQRDFQVGAGAGAQREGVRRRPSAGHVCLPGMGQCPLVAGRRRRQHPHAHGACNTPPPRRARGGDAQPGQQHAPEHGCRGPVRQEPGR